MGGELAPDVEQGYAVISVAQSEQLAILGSLDQLTRAILDAVGVGFCIWIRLL